MLLRRTPVPSAYRTRCPLFFVFFAVGLVYKLQASDALVQRTRGRRHTQIEDEYVVLRDALTSRATPTMKAASFVDSTRSESKHLAEPRVISTREAERIVDEVGGNRRFENCSVVGNDSSMRHSSLGQEIDKASAVYRMNFAPLKHYQADVGSKTHTQCLNPEKMRLQLRTNFQWHTDAGEKPERVLVVGDIPGTDASGALGPCVDRSPGGLCIKRTTDQTVKSMNIAVQKLTEELLYTLQEGVGEEGGVPTTGLYCLILALTECLRVDVYGIGVGTMKKEDLTDLEYFKDPHFRGWDSRHSAEAERTLLRVLASRVWNNALVSPMGDMRWHNPLKSHELVNAALLSQAPCISGIRC